MFLNKDLIIEKLNDEICYLEEEIGDLKSEVEELREYRDLYLELLDKEK